VGGGGGAWTVTAVEAAVVKPRESLQVALTVIGPGDAPAVLKVATFPLPEIVPPLAVQPETVTGTPSGLVQVHVTFAVPPVSRAVGLAEQLMVGGFFGGSFTVNDAVQLASPFFFTFGSTT
jgi:hypothetical protein